VSDAPAPSHWPDEIRLNKEKTRLRVRFGADKTFELPAEYLRVESPSAEVQGHGPGQRQTVGGKLRVTITALEPVGHYAVRIIFSDGHDTGLFTWAYLHQLGEEQETKWASYLEELAVQGLRRE